MEQLAQCQYLTNLINTDMWMVSAFLWGAEFLMPWCHFGSNVPLHSVLA